MILYDPSLNMAFPDYGIMLPISGERALHIRSFVSRCAAKTPARTAPPVFNIKEALEYLGEDASGALITREDVARVHEAQFTGDLFGGGPEGQQGLEKALLTAYELIGPDGKPHRYEPQMARKPLTELFKTVCAQVGGTYLACRLALGAPPAGDGAYGFCYYLGGGMHHARYDSGAGFCLINDIIIAARKIQAEGRAGLIWIIDTDAHKGDGSAELARFMRDRRDPFGSRIRTLSVHMASGWPLDSESLAAAQPGRAPLLASDVDIPIEQGEEASYISALEQGLSSLEEAEGGGKPDLAIVVDGADPYEHDGLPSSRPLALSLEQCVGRDRLMYSFFRQRNIPSAWIMAGGYGDRAWEPPAHFLCSLLERPLERDLRR